MHVLIWAVVCVICLIVEAITIGDLITIWFALGALVACIVSAFVTNTTLEVVIFVVVAFVSMLSLRPLFMKVLKNSNSKTNLDTIIGSKIKLITPITTETLGTAKIDGVVWNVASESDAEIEAGTYCEVVRIEGNKLIAKIKK